ncbi:hypothetical protein ACWDCB_44420 [Streptomyces sp. NPDC001178]
MSSAVACGQIGPDRAPEGGGHLVRELGEAAGLAPPAYRRSAACTAAAADATASLALQLHDPSPTPGFAQAGPMPPRGGCKA